MINKVSFLQISLNKFEEILKLIYDKNSVVESLELKFIENNDIIRGTVEDIKDFNEGIICLSNNYDIMKDSIKKKNNIIEVNNINGLSDKKKLFIILENYLDLRQVVFFQ